MDFVLSLAHFCELHGPISVLCTQALPASCSTCYQSTAAPASEEPTVQPPTNHLSSPKYRRQSSGAQGGIATGEGDGCASCRMSLPEDAHYDAQGNLVKIMRDRHDSLPLRTREEVHACTNQPADSADTNGIQLFSVSPDLFCSAEDTSLCHTHRLEYVSSPSPAESEIFSTLRRATIRTLSGEQLPRGQTSGPLWFGDPVAGYTIAYVFRLADSHARGRQRYYALLALAGADRKRAFEACTLIWSFFERIAMKIVEMAEEVSGRTFNDDDSPPEKSQVTPISSFLTQRTMDPDGYPRRGTANVRANGIAELVDNDRFFCELHMMFVGILQDLGRLLGGLRIRSPEAHENTVEVSDDFDCAKQTPNDEEDKEDRPRRLLNMENRKSGDGRPVMTQYSKPLCSPTMVLHRQQVVV